MSEQAAGDPAAVHETTPPETVVYETTVTKVGGEADQLREHGLVILFGPGAGPDVTDIAVIHEPRIADDGPVAGDLLELGGVRLPVVAVGHLVRDNLLELGHFDVRADGRTAPMMPGDVCVTETPLTLPRVGDTIRILRPSS